MKKLFHAYAFFCAFFVMLALSLTVVATVTWYKMKSDYQQMEYLTASKSNEIIRAIFALLYKAEALSTLVIQGSGEIRNFEQIAPIIINSPAIRNILVAPGGVVSKVYPLASNERLLGFNMLGPGDGNKEAHLAKKEKRLTLGGPFHAMQGGQILVGRLPVFSQIEGKDDFWGLVSVTLNYPDALAEVRLEELENLGFACEIWRINPDQGDKQIILNTAAAPLHKPLEREFALLNARWKISIAPLRVWYQSFSFYGMLFASLICSSLTGLIAHNYWEMRQIRSSLENMARHDSLTGLPNRLFAFEQLKQTLTAYRGKKGFFLLGYLDLNGFKQINDTYGHHIGDVVLQEAARHIRSVLPEGQCVARIGGDEFIVIQTDLPQAPEYAEPENGTEPSDLPRPVPPFVVEAAEALCAALSQPFAVSAVRGLTVSASAGIAIYPVHGTTTEILTSYADSAMYRNKNNGQGEPYVSYNFRQASRDTSCPPTIEDRRA